MGKEIKWLTQRRIQPHLFLPISILLWQLLVLKLSVLHLLTMQSREQQLCHASSAVFTPQQHELLHSYMHKRVAEPGSSIFKWPRRCAGDETHSQTTVLLKALENGSGKDLKRELHLSQSSSAADEPCQEVG